jgi:hypothetical protein
MLDPSILASLCCRFDMTIAMPFIIGDGDMCLRILCDNVSKAQAVDSPISIRNDSRSLYRGEDDTENCFPIRIAEAFPAHELRIEDAVVCIELSDFFSHFDGHHFRGLRGARVTAMRTMLCTFPCNPESGFQETITFCPKLAGSAVAIALPVAGFFKANVAWGSSNHYARILSRILWKVKNKVAPACGLCEPWDMLDGTGA